MMVVPGSRVARWGAVLVLACAPAAVAAPAGVSAAAAASAAASTQAPQTDPLLLVFQTRLHTIGGPHAGTEAEITFRIRDGKPNGPIIWIQGPQPVSLRDGYFRTVQIGRASCRERV